MEKCYEFLFCEVEDCARREVEDKQCWEIEGTSCYGHSDLFSNFRLLIEGKMDACKKCSYYKLYYNS